MRSARSGGWWSVGFACPARPVAVTLFRGFSRVFGRRSSSLLTPGRLASERWRPEACCSRKSLSCSSVARIWYTPAVFRTPSSLAHAVSRIIQWFNLLRFRFLMDFTRETPVAVSWCENRHACRLHGESHFPALHHYSTENSTERRTILLRGKYVYIVRDLLPGRLNAPIAHPSRAAAKPAWARLRAGLTSSCEGRRSDHGGAPVECSAGGSPPRACGTRIGAASHVRAASCCAPAW